MNVIAVIIIMAMSWAEQTSQDASTILGKEDKEICIPKNGTYRYEIEQGIYLYDGNRDFADADLLNEGKPINFSYPCLTWKDVQDSIIKELGEGIRHQLNVFPTETQDHKFCRFVPLGGSRHHFNRFPGWQYGPWCYVDLTDKRMRADSSDISGFGFTRIVPWPCFKLCKEGNLNDALIAQYRLLLETK
uniref:Kringle domain-containing protein n=1 Tax=Acrobeloides nanus TaxID=290746 RepID=A0A914CAD7_9BILA